MTAMFKVSRQLVVATLSNPVHTTTPPMSQLILESIATAFEQLKDDVHIAMHTQIGDSSQLEQRITACSRLLLHVNQVG